MNKLIHFLTDLAAPGCPSMGIGPGIIRILGNRFIKGIASFFHIPGYAESFTLMSIGDGAKRICAIGTVH